MPAPGLVWQLALTGLGVSLAAIAELTSRLGAACQLCERSRPAHGVAELVSAHHDATAL